MTSEALLVVGVLMATAVWLAMNNAVAAHRASRQRVIAQRGLSCEGRVVAIQRPFMLDDCTRLYVDFQPPGAAEPVRVCHVDRGGAVAEFLATGSIVTVRYMPQRPRHAVIGKPVSVEAQGEG